MSTKKRKNPDGPKGPATPVVKANLSDGTPRLSGYMVGIGPIILTLLMTKLDSDARAIIETYLKLVTLATGV